MLWQALLDDWVCGPLVSKPKSRRLRLSSITTRSWRKWRLFGIKIIFFPGLSCRFAQSIRVSNKKLGVCHITWLVSGHVTKKFWPKNGPHNFKTSPTCIDLLDLLDLRRVVFSNAVGQFSPRISASHHWSYLLYTFHSSISSYGVHECKVWSTSLRFTVGGFP